MKDKIARVTALLPQVFEWAREANPMQPLTSGVWAVETSVDGANLGELRQIQLRESDIITFHNYSWPEYFKRQLSLAEEIQPACDLHGIHGAFSGQHL